MPVVSCCHTNQSLVREESAAEDMLDKVLLAFRSFNSKSPISIDFSKRQQHMIRIYSVGEIEIPFLTVTYVYSQIGTEGRATKVLGWPFEVVRLTEYPVVLCADLWDIVGIFVS